MPKALVSMARVPVIGYWKGSQALRQLPIRVTSSTTRRGAHLSADTDSVDEEAPRVDDDPDIEVVGPGAGEEDRTDQHDEGVLAETELATDPVSLDTDNRLTDDDTASLSVVDGIDPVCRRFEGSKSETDGRAARRESVNSLSSQTVGLFPQHCGQVLAKSDLRLPIEKRTKPVVASRSAKERFSPQVESAAAHPRQRGPFRSGRICSSTPSRALPGPA